MRALPHNLALVEYDYLVGPHDGGNALGNDDLGLAGETLRKRISERCIGLVVERRKTVVEQQRPSIDRKGAGDGQALALAARYVRTALGNLSLEPLFFRFDELARLRNIYCLANALIRKVILAVTDVGPDGARE